MSKKRKLCKHKQSRPSNFKKQQDPATAVAVLRTIPTPAIVATIDAMFTILSDRGELVRDWDDKQKIVQKVKIIRGKVFILAPKETPETEDTDGKLENHSQSG